MITLFKRLFPAIVDSKNTYVESKADEEIIDGKLFAMVINEWLEFHKIEIAESTYYGYKILCPTLKEYFQDISIEKIDTFYINTTIAAMKKKGMSNTVINSYCKILKMCFDYACDMGYIIENPVNKASVPKVTRHTEINPFTMQEVIRLLEQDCVQWVRDGIVIAFHTGMRRGEIYALKWSDINFDQRFIMVQRAQSFAGSKVVIKSTKTACGVRRIDIDKYFASYLAKMKKDSDSDYVFAPPPKSKYPFRVPWNISAYVKEVCMSAGIAPRNFHALRHTHATVLLAYGIHPKIVQERLGHSDISITVMTYSHVLPTIQREAVQVFEKICGQFYNKDVSDLFASIIDLTDLKCIEAKSFHEAS